MFMFSMLRTVLKYEKKCTQFSHLLHISNDKKLEIMSGKNPEFLRNSFILQDQIFFKFPEKSTKVSFQIMMCVLKLSNRFHFSIQG